MYSIVLVNHFHYGLSQKIHQEINKCDEGDIQTHKQLFK